MTEKLPFLSDEWIDAARALRAQHQGPAAQPPVRMNLVVEEVPFGSGSLEAHVDTTGGEVEIELGHLESPDVRVVLDYDTARAVLVESDGQAAIQAFMAGKIRVEGDLAKLLQYQASPLSPTDVSLSQQIRAITA